MLLPEAAGAATSEPAGYGSVPRVLDRDRHPEGLGRTGRVAALEEPASGQLAGQPAALRAVEGAGLGQLDERVDRAGRGSGVERELDVTAVGGHGRRLGGWQPHGRIGQLHALARSPSRR